MKIFRSSDIHISNSLENIANFLCLMFAANANAKKEAKNFNNWIEFHFKFQSFGHEYVRLTSCFVCQRNFSFFSQFLVPTKGFSYFDFRLKYYWKAIHHFCNWNENNKRKTSKMPQANVWEMFCVFRVFPCFFYDFLLQHIQIGKQRIIRWFFVFLDRSVCMWMCHKRTEHNQNILRAWTRSTRTLQGSEKISRWGNINFRWCT